MILATSCQTQGTQTKTEDQETNVAVVSADSQQTPVEVPPPLPRYTIDELTGKIDPAKDSNFVSVPREYMTKDRMFLRRETFNAFLRMDSAARQDGIRLKIVSGTRTFWDQKGIWERKWSGARLVEGKNLATAIPDADTRALKILEYSSMPSTSRHHWGTDIDLNNLNNSWFESGEGLKIYEWLTTNASSFGFCQVYSPKGADRPAGYEEEKWHWSYLPLASQMLDEYVRMIDATNIAGFKGSETAVGIDVVKNYVEGINPECKK